MRTMLYVRKADRETYLIFGKTMDTYYLIADVFCDFMTEIFGDDWLDVADHVTEEDYTGIEVKVDIVNW